MLRLMVMVMLVLNERSRRGVEPTLQFDNNIVQKSQRGGGKRQSMQQGLLLGDSWYRRRYFAIVFRFHFFLRCD
jgi:hypothetical protein